MTIFEAVKSTVTPRMAAEHYGLNVSRNGMVCCPFHRDLHPSMKLALDSITPADFKSMTAQCNADIKAAERELAELREQQESSEEFRSNMERIRKVLRDAERDCQSGEISKEFVDTFVVDTPHR